jgi:Na+/H+ antiporter NhaD/arsenite permease-like protein
MLNQPGSLHQPPSIFWIWPFVAILLAIAILPLIRRTHHWWEHNSNKLLLAFVLGGATLLYYGLRGYGIELHENSTPPPAALSAQTSEPGSPQGEPHKVEERTFSAPGWPTVQSVLHHAISVEYIPFIVLLFSLYVIAGGIVVRGDIEATPLANTTILAIGGLLASLIGTTGAAMVLIRLLLKTNSERKRKVHTFIFFIFIVANAGGLLLPTGDPPLFLGYLLGVDFLWTLRLWPQWLFMVGSLLVVYFIWDTRAHGREARADVVRDRTVLRPVRVAGLLNLVWLIGVVIAVATLDPSKPFPGTSWHAFPYLRELVQLGLVIISLVTTHPTIRVENQFTYAAIGEVACLFIGIFITMQVPIEILQARGPQLGLVTPSQFFWATGVLSSFLDNAPTYVVYFATAGTLTPAGMPLLHGVQTATSAIPAALLAAISCGAVFMGANTYIGNGPNFMVKAIAEQSGVKMPSFFGYLVYSCLVLLPLFAAMTLIFFRT